MLGYVVKAPDGTLLPSSLFGLQLNNPHDPPLRNFNRIGYGRQSPPSLRDYDLVATQDEVARQVQERLRAYPRLRFVRVTQVVIGAVDTKRVGIVEETPWLIPNPHYWRKGR